MTTELDRVIERFHTAQDAWWDACAKARIDLHGSVPDLILNDKVRDFLTTEAPEVYAEIQAATIAHEQALAGLRSREVDAIERNVAFFTFQRERS